MTIFNNKKGSKTKAWIGIGITLLLIGLLFCFRSYASKELLEETLDEPFGEKQVEDEKTESIKDEAEENIMFEEAEPITDDLRLHGFPYIKSTNRLKPGDYIDVRISFANGGDFVLLSKKKIQAMGPLREEGAEALWLAVSEEEILRLSSAAVDAYINEGCCIYAIQYLSETQQGAVVNYTVSDLVKQLMEDDPNIIKRAENVEEWQSWELYKEKAVEEGGRNREDSGSFSDVFEETGEVYPDQEEIIYMD